MRPPSDVVVSHDQSVDLVSRILRQLRWSRGELETADQERHQGPRRKIFTWQIIVGLIAHTLPFAGRFSQCLRHFFGMTLCDSALSQRRQQLGEDIFLLIMRETLRPLADAQLHEGCFFAGLRLLGIDGTRWNVTNTAQHLARMTKMQTSNGIAAFAHIRMAALVELGTHAPLHATLGLDGESEQALADWADFVLDVCQDQVRFMANMLDFETLLARLDACLVFEASVLQSGVRRESLRGLHYLFLSGEDLARGDFKAMMGLSDRGATDALGALLRRGLLKSDSPKGPVRFGLPQHALRFLFPRLWPEAEADSGHPQA